MVVPGHKNSYVVTDLSPVTEYEVLLSAVYRDEAESSAIPASVVTRKTKKIQLIFSYG